MRLPPWTWKILRSRRTRIAAGCFPFALLIAIAVFYTGVNAWAVHVQRKQAAGLAARGYQASFDAYCHGGVDPAADVFQHPAMKEELDQGWIIGKSEAEDGLASKRPGTTQALARPADLMKLFTPAPADEKEAANRLLALDPVVEVHWQNLRPAFSRSDAAWPGASESEVPSSILRLRSLSDYAKVHALAEMVKGNQDEVFADLQAMIDLERQALSSRPLIVSILVGSILQSNVSDFVWEGIHRGFWDDPALARISECLAVLDPSVSTVPALRGEVAFIVSSASATLEVAAGTGNLADFQWKELWTLDRKQAVKAWRSLWLNLRPIGFSRLEAIDMAEDYISVIRSQEGRSKPRLTIPDIVSLKATLGASTHAEDLYVPIRLAAESALQIQAQLEVLRTGIALERYRLKNGSYPAALIDLVPAFLPVVAPDSFAEQPLRYRLQADGSPVVWSVGKNLINDGGIPNRSRSKGDVVWLTQPLPGFTERDYRR